MTARILAVDDEPDLLELVRLSLSEAGFAVETAASGREALEKLQRTAPDLVVQRLVAGRHDLIPGDRVERLARIRGHCASMGHLSASSRACKI